MKLTPYQGYTTIRVVVNHLTKTAHFIASGGLLTTQDTDHLFKHNIFCLHGLFTSVLSDLGSHLVSLFWWKFLHLLGIKPCTITVCQPSSNGQAERVNQALKQYLSCFLNYHQDNWRALIPHAEFAYNNSPHAMTQQISFFTNYVFHPWYHPQIPLNSPKPTIVDLAAYIYHIHQELRHRSDEAKTAYKIHANQHCDNI